MKKFLYNILITICCLFSFNYVQAAEIKFVQVSDTHYSQSNPYSEQVLKAAVADINKLDNVSFVVFTGDNIDKPNPDDLAKFVNIVNKLNPPYYLVIGNHDVFKTNGLSKKEYFEVVKNNNLFYKNTTPNYSFTKGEYAFIVVDGAKELIPGTVGYYKKETLDWLQKKLKKYNKKQVVILQHFPILSPNETKSHRTYKAEEYLEMLKKYPNVKAVVSGHFHVNFEKMQDGIYHISSPSLLAQPNQYKVIDMVTTKGFSTMIYTQLRELDVK